MSKYNCEKNLDGKNHYHPKNLDGKNHYHPRILTNHKKVGSSRISISLKFWSLVRNGFSHPNFLDSSSFSHPNCFDNCVLTSFCLFYSTNFEFLSGMLLPRNINRSSSFYKGPRTCKVRGPFGSLDFQTLLVLGPLQKLILPLTFCSNVPIPVP